MKNETKKNMKNGEKRKRDHKGVLLPLPRGGQRRTGLEWESARTSASRFREMKVTLRHCMLNLEEKEVGQNNWKDPACLAAQACRWSTIHQHMLERHATSVGAWAAVMCTTPSFSESIGDYPHTIPTPRRWLWVEWIDSASNPADGLSRQGLPIRCLALLHR